MPAPDSTIEQVRASVLRYVRLYEEAQITLGDLAAELAALAPPYEHALGAVDDFYLPVLQAARRRERDGAGASYEELESALTVFRRADAAW